MEMLAYVFWHWRSPEVDAASYEDDLRAFHQALAKAAPAGFRSSAVLRLDGAEPWVEGDAFADWYLVEDWAALGALNEAAVARATKGVHDRVAHASAGGAGAVYGLRSGVPDPAEARSSAFFDKPRGTGYDDFYAGIRAATDVPGASLWRRQMVLGPAPEFCLFAADSLELPAELEPLSARVELAWPLPG